MALFILVPLSINSSFNQYIFYPIFNEKMNIHKRAIYNPLFKTLHVLEIKKILTSRTIFSDTILSTHLVAFIDTITQL